MIATNGVASAKQGQATRSGAKARPKPARSRGVGARNPLITFLFQLRGPTKSGPPISYYKKIKMSRVNARLRALDILVKCI